MRRLPFRRRTPIFYGWYIVGAALIAQFVAAGSQAYAIGVFLKPMVSELHWTRESFSAVQTLSTVVMGTLGLVVGGLIDRRGPRLLMIAGAIVAGSALVATSRVHELWQFYLLRGVGQTVGSAMMGNLVVNVTVAKWFVARRGMAIAMASLGISLGGVLMAPMVAIFVGAYGWRPAWVMLGCVVWALMLPAAFVMRSAPERYGLTPDGMTLEEARAYGQRRRRASAASETQWTRAEAVRTPAIWLVILAYGVANIGLGAMLIHMISFLTDQGFSQGTAALMFTAQGWASLVSKPIWGALMDRFHARFLSAVGFVLSAAATIGLLGAASLGSAPVLTLLLACYGLANGGVVPLQETVWASYFGRQHLGQIRSVAMPFSIIFGAGGPLLAGALFDRTGSYVSAFSIFAGFQTLGVLLVLIARPPRRRGEPGGAAAHAEQPPVPAALAGPAAVPGP